MFPRYRVGPMCSMPSCSRWVDDVHHVVRRSFIGGDVAWVKIGETIIGNLSGLCRRHHQAITDNQAKILFNSETSEYQWVECETGENLGRLHPHPPVQGRKISPELRSALQQDLSIIGPASRPLCDGCGRPLPHRHDDEEKRKREPAKRRKTWTVKVPAEAEEDGAVVLDTLVDECATIFGREKGENLRYYVLAQALALVIQHEHLLGG
jgi:hypothetical protein